MLATITTLGRNGVQDWLLQRVTALIMTFYVAYLSYFVFFQEVTFKQWKMLFEGNCMMYFSLLFILSVVFHAWIGIWVVTTDYLKATWLRLTTQMAVALLLGYYLMWGIKILWRL